MAENDAAPNLTGVFSGNPFAANQRGISDLERNYQNQRTLSNLAGGRIPGGPAGINDSGGAYWRQVQSDELVTNRLNGILSRGGAYIQGARSRAGRAAAMRGAFNTDLAIANAEDAAIERAGALAAQEADAYGRAAAQNQDAFNQYRIAQERNLTDIQTADINAGAQVASAQIRVSGDLIQQERDQRWRTSEREADQRFRSSENQLDREHQMRLQDDEQAFRAEHDLNVMRESNSLQASNLLLTTFLSNPDLWNDPTALSGLQNVLSQIFPNLFRPNVGTSTTAATGPASNPAPANVNSQQIGATPSGGTTAGRYGSSGTRNPSIDPGGVTAGPYVPPQRPDARPGGMSGPSGPRGGRGGAASYVGMRNQMQAATMPPRRGRRV